MRIFWTDGACVPNPGEGGAAVVESASDDPTATDGKLVWSGTESNTTNNRMEGAAIVAALNLSRGEDVLIITDSMLWINLLTKNWRAKKNRDLVKAAKKLMEGRNVEFRHVKAHTGAAMNEKADRASVRAAGNPDESAKKKKRYPSIDDPVPGIGMSGDVRSYHLYMEKGIREVR